MYKYVTSLKLKVTENQIDRVIQIYVAKKNNKVWAVINCFRYKKGPTFVHAYTVS